MLAKKLASRRSTGGTRPALDYTALRSIPIILDEEILYIMDAAYEEKRKKEHQAKSLLANIDSYLLGELGICVPQDGNYIGMRMFYVGSEKVINDRFDPNYYKGVDAFAESISKSKYQVVNLGDVIGTVRNGVEIRDYVEKGYRYLRVSDMSKSGIVNNNERYVYAERIPSKVKLTTKELLISRSGSLGLVNAVTDEIEDSIISSHIFKLTLCSNVSNYYLQELLRSPLGQLQFFKKNNGGIIPEISQDALRSIRIILPNLTKQNEIVAEINAIREKAKELQHQAEEVVNIAKTQVNKILLEGGL